MFKKPDMNEMLLFIEQTHTVEKHRVSRQDINIMMKDPKCAKPNPFVIGHFDALNYMLSLPTSPDFPAKDTKMLGNQYRSEESLFWLKKLHELMTTPLVKASFTIDWEDHIQIHKHECGQFRNVPMALAFSMTPDPVYIPQILHIWINEIFALNEEVKNLVDNPYGLTREKSQQLQQIANDTNLLFCSLHPFHYGSNRLGRLIENLLRINWRMKWKHVPLNREYDAYVQTMQVYQKTEIPKWIEKTKNLK